MRARFVPMFFVCVAGCAGSSAPTDTQSTSTPAATTAAPPAISASAKPSPPVAATDPNLCGAGKPDGWKDCAGKEVEVRGQTPKMVYQHPMLAPINPLGGAQPKVHQEYLEVTEGTQIVVLTSEPSKCTGAMRVKGKLRAVDLGGPAGTKESYKGWAIDDAKVICE